MQLKNDPQSINQLLLTIENHYKNNRKKWVVHAYLPIADTNGSEKSVEFLIDGKHLAKYSISPSDRGAGFLGGVSLAIGPRFFGPFEFWSYRDGERFRMGTEVFDIEINLNLLDEFIEQGEKKSS